METKPFDESIIDSLKECTDQSAFETLCKLILETTISKNHRAISEAIMTSPLRKELQSTERVLRKITKEEIAAQENTGDDDPDKIKGLRA